MRVTRLEVNFDEAVLPEIIQSLPDTDKGCPSLETPKLTPEDKRDKACKGLKSNYREDKAIT